MLKVSVYITIGSLKFTWVNDVSIKSSWRDMTQTCSIKLPRNIKLQDKKLEELIQIDDKVTVQLGYNDILKTEFKGYVTGLKPQFPYEITCEDEMRMLKRGSLNFNLKNGKLIDVLKSIYSGPVNAFDADLGDFRANKATGANILNKIKEVYGLYSFFILDSTGTPVLVCGKMYERADQQTHNFSFERNVISTGSLEFKRKEDVRIKVKAISILSNNTKIEKELGDEDGQERTLHFFNLTEKELTEAATREMDKLKYDGYRGKFTQFGLAFTRVGDIANISQDSYKGRDGKFYIDAVTINFGMNGYRRENELGPKAA